MPNSPFDAHRRDLAALAHDSRRRTLAPRAGRDFASNDYLGLADSDALRTALAAGIERGLPAGSGGSPHTSTARSSQRASCGILGATSVANSSG